MGSIKINTGKANQTVNTTTVWDRIIALENNMGVIEGETISNILEAKADKTEVATLSSQLAEKVHYFVNVSDMKSSNKLKSGDYVVTMGYYAANDGGNGAYNVVSSTSKTADDGAIIALSNGLFAELVINDNTLNVKQYGAKGILNSGFDDMKYFLKLATFINTYKTVNKIIIPSGHYYFSALDENGQMPVAYTKPKRVNFFKINGLTIIGEGTPTIYMTGLDCNYLNGQVDFQSQGNDIFCAFTATRCDDVLIENINFIGTYTTPWVKFYFIRNGDGSSTVAPRTKAISIRGCYGVTIRNIKGYDIEGNVIALGASDTVVDKDPNEGIGGFRQSRNINISDIYIKRTFENGINFFGGTYDSYVENIYAENCANSIETACIGFSVNNLTAVKCRGAGLTLDGSNQNASNMNIYDCQRLDENGIVDPNYAVGINIQQGTNITVTNAVIKGCTKQGISVQQLCKNVTISNVIVTGNATILNEPQVTVKGNDANNKIKGFIFTNSFIDSSHITDGVYTFAPILLANTENAFIANNVFTKATNSNASVNASIGNENLTIFNNKVDKNISVNTANVHNVLNNIGMTEERRYFQGYEVPTAGTWIIGDFVRIYTPAKVTINTEDFVHVGWRCVVTGTQGTLNSGTTTGSITSGTAILTVNSATGLIVGQYLNIAGVGGAKKIIAIDGTTITLSSNANVTVTNVSVTFSNATWTKELVKIFP